MKKIITPIILLAILSFLFSSCESQKVVLNREVDNSTYGKMLLGAQSPSQFLKEPYSAWYSSEFEEYQPDTETLQLLKKAKLNSYKITVFLGTWCGDSHREFPRFMKTLESAGYNNDKLEIIALNRKKESPTGEETLYNIQRVPTFIIKKYGKEVGRIIENPNSGYIEKDLLEIVQKNKSSAKDLFK